MVDTTAVSELRPPGSHDVVPGPLQCLLDGRFKLLPRAFEHLSWWSIMPYEKDGACALVGLDLCLWWDFLWVSTPPKRGGRPPSTREANHGPVQGVNSACGGKGEVDSHKEAHAK